MHELIMYIYNTLSRVSCQDFNWKNLEKQQYGIGPYDDMKFISFHQDAVQRLLKP